MFELLFTLLISNSYDDDRLNYELSVPTYFSQERPVLQGDAALVFDLESNTVVFAEEPLKTISIASLTKLMTALIILENHDLSEVVKVDHTGYSLPVGGVTVPQGTEITVSELLHALLIKSSNDVAYILAHYDAGSIEGFVAKMNERAIDLGMTGTNFDNPAGFDGSKNFSNANDLLKLSLLVWNFSEVKEIVSKKNYTVKSVDNRWQKNLVTTNLLLESNYPFVGLKTGTSPDASEAFIGITNDTEPKLIIVLGSNNRFQDTKLLWELFASNRALKK